jgi:predicted Zn-dependent peptidase
MKSKTSKKSKRSSARKPKKADIPRPSFKKIILPNRITVLTERHPQSRSVSCGVWVNKGTRHELPHEAGLAHFIEHLVFKGTKKRNAYQISRDMEAVGGDLNAFTSRENTAFVTHSLSEDVGLSLDILSDLVCRPSFDALDIKKEKQVVVQEIMMSEDQLEDFVFDQYMEMAYPTGPLGKPILGTVKSIEGMKRDTIVDFHRRNYTPENIVVSVAGNLDHGHVVDLVEKHLKFPAGARAPRATPASKKARELAIAHKGKEALKHVRPEIAQFRNVIRKPSEQVHILIGHPTINYTDRLRFDAIIVNTLLGGGMTSRLYQTVREERGLVYSVYSQLMTFVDSGMNMIYAGTDAKKTPDVIELILKELRLLKKSGVKKSDIEFFKTQVKGSILLGAEDVENRMNSLAVNEMSFGRYRPVEDVIAGIESVTNDTIHEFIETRMDIDQLGMLLIGPMPEAATLKWLKSL